MHGHFLPVRLGKASSRRMPLNSALVLCASASVGRTSRWKALLKGAKYLVCRQVEATILSLVKRSRSAVVFPALSRPESAAEPVSLPCATWLACSGTRPAEPHKSSYTFSTDANFTHKAHTQPHLATQSSDNGTDLHASRS